LNQQQLFPGQLQEQQQQLQAQQQAIAANQRKQQEGEVIRQAYVKNSGDIDKVISDAAKNPVVSPEALQALQLHSEDLKQKRAAATTAELSLRATQVDNLRGALKPVYDMPANAPPAELEAAYQRQRAQVLQSPQAFGIADPSQIPEHFPGKQAGEFLMAGMIGESKQLAQETTRRENALTEAKTGQALAETAKLGEFAPSDNQLYNLATSPQTAHTPQGQQAAAILGAKQRERLQLSGAEAGARVAAENSPQAIQGAVAKKQAMDAATGAGEQVYATDRTGRTMLMAKSDAINAGYGYMKVAPKQVSEDRQLNNRLSDVQQKISQYEQSFQQPLDSHGWFSSSDRSLIAQAIGTDKLKFGAFGAELPIDWGNKLGRSSLFKGMSPQAQQRVISYFNARESLVGYQRVLSGSGRSSEKSLELNLDTLPSPIDPENYAGNALKAFKQNLAIAGQGLPVLPGVRTPEEVEHNK